jgi:hypothetical protein
MPKLDPRVLLRTAGNYLREHPQEIVRAARGALDLRLGLPMDAIRYLVNEFASQQKRPPQDIVIEAVPPGIRIAATVDAMGTPVRASFTLTIEAIGISTVEARVVVRIQNLALTVIGESSSPLAGLLRSDIIDLSKPGNLIALLPKRPAVLLEAKDDRLTLDFLKLRQVAKNPKIRRALAVLTPVIGVRAVRTDGDHLDVQLAADLSMVSQAIAAARQPV